MSCSRGGLPAPMMTAPSPQCAANPVPQAPYELAVLVMARREVLVQLDDDLVERLDRLATTLGTNRSELLRRGAQAVIEAETLIAADRALVAAYRRQPADPALVRSAAAAGRPHQPSVVARNEIYWADLGPPAGRRPVCVLTRDAAAAVLTAVTCAPITRTIRGILSEVGIGTQQGLPEPCVISCDNIITVPVNDLDRVPVGRLDEMKRAELDQALRYALDIVY